MFEIEPSAVFHWNGPSVPDLGQGLSPHICQSIVFQGFQNVYPSLVIEEDTHLLLNVPALQFHEET